MRLQLLRDPRLLVADGPAERSVPLGAGDAALLALLALDGPTTRARAIELLWPEESDPSRARNALRQRLFRLRRTVGADVVTSDERLALMPGLAHDLGDPRERLAADPAHALEGELLGEQRYDGWVEFSAWLERARERWRGQRREALAELASRLEDEQRIAEALLAAERLAREDPLAEHAQRRLMRLHYRRGDRSAALAVYARFRERLAEQLGEAPARETRELAQAIEASGALPVAAAPVRLGLLRPPRLVGREREWAALEAAFAAGRIAFVRGEPGVGKSRLLGDFAEGRDWLRVAARPGDARVPFALLARLGRAAVEREPPPALDARTRAELARLLPELGEASEGRLDARRLQQAVAQALGACAASGMRGIAIDDLPFGDEASLDLMPALVDASSDDGDPAPRPPAVPCWLFTLRPHEPPSQLVAWLDSLEADRHARIDLAPLDAQGVAALLASLELPGLDVARWAPRVHRHSGGNPLFILETLRALLAGGAAALAGEGRLPLPENLRVSIGKRLAQLGPAALKLARVAAVAGLDFSVDLAAAVLGQHALDLLEPWQELEAAQVVHGRAFAHDLIYEVTRDGIPVALRRWLHARCAEWLAAHDGLAVRLALHWREAGEPARAAPCFERAADEARAAGRLAEQTRWLQAAIDAHGEAGNEARRFEAMLAQAIAAREALAPEAALAAAQALLDAAVEARQRGLAHLQVGSCHMNAARFAVASAAFDEAIAEATEARDDGTAQHARYLQALASAQLSGPAEALARMEPLAPWAEAQPDASLRHSFLADLAILCDQADQRRRARGLFERALGYFDAARETGNSAPTRMMFARSLLMLGDLGAARELLEQAVRERAELSEGDGGQGIEVLNLARVYTELGRYAEAIALLEPWLERLAAPQSAIVRGAMALVLARVHVHLGQTARALNFAKQVGDGEAGEAALPFHQRAALLWTRALFAVERPLERTRLLDEALACFAANDLPFARLPIVFDRLACRPAPDAPERLREAVAECERRELLGPQRLGRMRLVQVLLARDEAATALAVARGLVEELPTGQPVGTYLPELYAACRAAALAGGDAGLARQCLDRAVQWIAAVSHAHVPPAFRDSFAHRNPVNRALLAASLAPAP